MAAYTSVYIIPKYTDPAASVAENKPIVPCSVWTAMMAIPDIFYGHIYSVLCKSWGHIHSVVTDYDITIPTLLSLALTQLENCTCIG